MKYRICKTARVVKFPSWYRIPSRITAGINPHPIGLETFSKRLALFIDFWYPESLGLTILKV